LQNIAKFFESEKALPFTTEIFVKTILEQVANRPIHVASSTGELSLLNNEAQSRKEHTMAHKATKPVYLSGSREKEPLVSISMVTYNRLDCLKQCVDSIRRHTTGRYELIIINNGSTDGSVDYLRSLPDITLIEIPTNGRPDIASLKGLSMARGDYVATISDDIIVTPGWMDLFLGHIKGNPKVGLIGPRSNLVSGSQLVPNVPYKNIAELDAFAQSWTRAFKGHCSPSNRLVGFIFFFSRELLNKIGGTDPIFSFGYNDDDFTLRAIIAGYDAIIANDIFIHHTGGPQVRGDLVYQKKLVESWEAFKTKWGLPPDLENRNLNVHGLLARRFDPDRHFVPLPDRSEVEKLIYKPASGHATRQPQDALDAPRVHTQDETPLVSAVVFARNAERFIRGCLEDLEDQTISNRLEIIVIDSASDQNEAAIVKAFQKKYSNIKYIKSEEQETVYGAWNRGIKAAAGKYITSANADDRHASHAFERMVHVLDNNPDIALVYADVWITEKENETFENFSPAGMFRGKEFDPETLLEGCCIGPQPMWRKSLHFKHGYFDETLSSAGELEFWLRMAQAEKFLHLKEFLGLALKSPTGIKTRGSKVSEEVLRVRRKYGLRLVKSGSDMENEACQDVPRSHSYNAWQKSTAIS
jgi:glycosyltransferase involved in cell wall biosynthesis